jgi:hypothetical protein
MLLTTPQRLRAPSGDGGLLAVPPLSRWTSLLDENRRELSRWDGDFQGRRAGRLRGQARREALTLARVYHDRFGVPTPAPVGPEAPVVLTGHQPELFHPGVWVKNLALAHLAAASGAVGLNLIVDNDLPKSSWIRVPTRSGGGLGVRSVPFDTEAGDVPYEDARVRDESVFQSFPLRVLETLDGLVREPVLNDYWPEVVRVSAQTEHVGTRFAVARRRLEERWGARNWEVPLSWLCETDSFRWFVCHLLAHLPRFQAVHNTALLDYRKAHRLRSRHHPVPALGREGDWLEAPFWAWRADQPRRRPLLARQLSHTLELRIAGEPSPLLELPLAPDREACCAVERLRELADRGVRLRTRALTTTMFARLLLGDLFLHGIGGAKYDELGDAIIREFLGLEPPPYLVLSQTIWLGLPIDPARPERLRQVDRQLRDLRFNPDRHLPPPHSPTTTSLLEARRRALDLPTRTRAQRRGRCAAIRGCNQALGPLVAAQESVLRAEREALLAGLRRNQMAWSREYPFVLHDVERLRREFGQLASLA